MGLGEWTGEWPCLEAQRGVDRERLVSALVLMKVVVRILHSIILSFILKFFDYSFFIRVGGLLFHTSCLPLNDNISALFQIP